MAKSLQLLQVAGPFFQSPIIVLFKVLFKRSPIVEISALNQPRRVCLFN